MRLKSRVSILQAANDALAAKTWGLRLLPALHKFRDYYLVEMVGYCHVHALLGDTYICWSLEGAGRATCYWDGSPDPLTRQPCKHLASQAGSLFGVHWPLMFQPRDPHVAVRPGPEAPAMQPVLHCWSTSVAVLHDQLCPKSWASGLPEHAAAVSHLFSKAAEYKFQTLVICVQAWHATHELEFSSKWFKISSCLLWCKQECILTSYMQ